MFGWKLTEVLSFGATAGFLILLALATRPNSTILFKGEKRPSEKVIKYTHVIVLVALTLGFICVVASVISYAISGE